MATILIIDDQSSHRAKLKRALAKAGLFDRILEARDPEQGFEALHASPIDVVLCAVEVRDLDADQLFRAKATSPGGATVAFLFITDSADTECKARLLEAGACDAIDRPLYFPELIARLKQHLAVKWLRDELLRKNEALERLSTTDELTGLRNRRFLMESLSREFMRARRFRTPLTALMFDIDHFKQVNDQFGHQAGDAVLRGVAGLFLTQTRSTDTVGRYGGEEIVVILTQTGIGGGRAYGEICRANVEETPFVIPGSKPITVTISAGVATFTPKMKTPADLLAAADEAVYRAKASGRNRVED
jgi:two-component system cell cycle response regulator